MISYFDISESYGLTDDVFISQCMAERYSIGDIGIDNPLGRGVLIDLLDLDPQLFSRWRQRAVEQVDRPEMEIGWSTGGTLSKADFMDQLKARIGSHRVTRCSITVFAVGAALLRLDFGPDIPVGLTRGLSRCFEFAAYLPEISNDLYAVAREAARAAVRDLDANELARLTARPGPEDGPPCGNYVESSLLAHAGFTNVLLFGDPGDSDEVVHNTKAAFDMEANNLDGENEVEFEYHGTLHFTWATCALDARRIVSGADDGAAQDKAGELPAGRVLASMEIAHTFLAACEAFLALVRTEVVAEVEGYAKAEPAGRTSRDLNHLRTFALALVSLTNFNLVTPTDEDRKYFSLYNVEAKLEDKHAYIQESCDLLFNVQEAEYQRQQTANDRYLTYFLAVLTSMTLVSVLADGYSFICGQTSPLIRERAYRVHMLILVLLLGVMLMVLACRRRSSLERRRSQWRRLLSWMRAYMRRR